MRASPDERARRRLAGERGVSIVEAAIALPVVIVFLFAVIDFGWALNEWISLRNGVREGARQLVVGNVGEDTACQLTGLPGDGGDTNKGLCLVKDRIGLDDERTRVKLLCDDPDSDGRCGTDSTAADADHGTLVVCSMHDLDSLSGFFSFVLDRIEIDSHVEMRIEGTSDGDGLAPAAEAELSRTEWDDFCAEGG